VWGLSAIKTMKTLASKLAGNNKDKNAEIRKSIRTDVCFSLLKARTLAIRAPRSTLENQLFRVRNIR
jgi:hypothetical protein